MNLTDRLITEIVEKCDGLSITAEQASNILAYLQYGAPLARQPAAIDKEAILTVDMVRDAVFDAGFALPQWDRIRFQLNSALRKARATSAPSVEQDERVRQFEALCDLLPSDVSWGDHLTPDIALHIARAASTSANVAQGAEAAALWAAFDANGTLLAHSKLRPGLSDILNWEPLYRVAPPAQTALTDDARDAARYRWLRRRAFMLDESDDAVTTISLFKDEGPTGEFLDDQIDAALTDAQSASGADHAN